MPIECAVEISPVGQESFHALDKALMRQAFDLQNALGKFCDERIYQDELARRCREDGMQCQREVEVRVMHQDFVKLYFLDLVVEHGAIYELKTAESLAPMHQNQLINYLFLTGLHHGKLVNFRSASVESRFISTRLNREDRMKFHLDESGWQRCDGSERLTTILNSILRDWGAFLDMNLYREALLHLYGGPDSGYCPVAIEVDGRTVGFQKMCLLDPEHAWHLSAVKTSLLSHESHIRRLMRHTRLQSLFWINLNQNKITLKTLQK